MGGRKGGGAEGRRMGRRGRRKWPKYFSFETGTTAREDVSVRIAEAKCKVKITD
jgi:hypothetical protein